MPSSPGITMSVSEQLEALLGEERERLVGGGGGARRVPGGRERVAEQLLEEPLVVDDEDPAGRHALEVRLAGEGPLGGAAHGDARRGPRRR